MTRRLAVLAGLALLLQSGCQNDEIRSYQVAKPEKIELRLLAAMFQHGERTWFIKLMGPAAEVNEHKEAFDRFLQSVQFSDKTETPITWTVPEGWREERGSKLRYATFHLESKNQSLEVTVVALGREAGTLLANVNRWRGQIGLAPATQAELGKVSKEVKVHGVAGTLVDMAGKAVPMAAMTAPPNPGRAAPLAARSAPEDGQASPFKYALPQGWKALGAKGAMNLATFEISDGDRLARVTVLPLGGQAGGLVENVNRWRGQLGLDRVGDAEVRKEVRQIQVAGAAADYVDLLGPQTAGAERQRILAVIVPRGDSTWFFKMSGPADLVAKQKSAFEAFMSSVQFAGDAGAKDD